MSTRSGMLGSLGREATTTNKQAINRLGVHKVGHAGKFGKGRQQTTNKQAINRFGSAQGRACWEGEAINNQSTTVLGVHKVEHKLKNKLKHTIGVVSKFK